MEFELQPLTPPQQSWIRRPSIPEERKPPLTVRTLFVLCVALLALSSSFLAFKVRRHHRKDPPPPETYTVALHMALTFFNAQRSGQLLEQNNVSWRGDSCLHDGISTYNLVGGYYDAGDATKSNFPISFSMTMLSWSVIEYGAKYEAVGELNHVKGLIKWGTQYLLNTFVNNTATINAMVSQVGSPNDHNCWMRPEDIHYNRPVSFCYAGCSDLAAEMAAALASASIVFKDNDAYSKRLLAGATMLYTYAETMKARNTHWDELLWAGTWMFYASGDVAHLHRVTNRHLAHRAGAFSFGPSYGVFSSQNKLLGAQLLLTRLRLLLDPGYPYEEMLIEFHHQSGRVMCSYLPYFDKFNRTKGGLIQLNHGEPQPLQYAANAAFLATLFSDYLAASNMPGLYCGPIFYRNNILRSFSKSQIDYILGQNPQNMSYLVGFGLRYPKQVHHRGASIPMNKNVSCQEGRAWKESRKQNPNTIIGAMVAGPDNHDGFSDERTAYNYTEPTLVGNAGLVAALVALSGETSAFGAIDVNSYSVSICFFLL